MGFMDKFSLKGKKILITGGAQGIGREVGNILAECGAEVGIWDVNHALALKAAGEISQRYHVKSEAYSCDVASPEQVDAAMQAFVNDFGTLDGVFNNAGICQHKAAVDLIPEEWRKVVDINYSGVFFVARAAARQFIREGKKGSIVNTASMSGSIVNIPQKQASYNSSKAAVIHLTKSLAVEWAEYGIRVNSISPGYIWTEMTEKVDKSMRDFWLGLIPFKRMGTPEELAGGVIYLLSDASSYTSGCDLVMDGCFTNI